MSRAAYCARFWNVLSGFEDAVVDNLFIVLQARSWASAEIFPGGATSTFHLSFFRLRTIQCKWTFTKRFTLSTPKRKFAILLQHLLNWGIIQYHYYFELQTTETELDLNYPQLRLLCLHKSLQLNLTSQNLV